VHTPGLERTAVEVAVRLSSGQDEQMISVQAEHRVAQCHLDGRGRRLVAEQQISRGEGVRIDGAGRGKP